MAIDKAKYERMVKDSTPGRFEGEPAETAYYYESMMNGMGASVDENSTSFDVDEEEARVFGLDSDCPIILEIDSQGFVTTYQVTPRELEDYLNILSEESGEEDT